MKGVAREVPDWVELGRVALADKVELGRDALAREESGQVASAGQAALVARAELAAPVALALVELADRVASVDRAVLEPVE